MDQGSMFCTFPQGKIAEDNFEQLKASQQKLLDARPEMRQLDKEIQNIHVILGEEDTADQDFVDADNISDTHSDTLVETNLTKSSVATSSRRALNPAHMPIRVPLNS